MMIQNDLREMLSDSQSSLMLRQAKPFFESMMEYKCALLEVETKLQVLNSEFALRHNRNPFESIKTRVKSPESILAKMKRREIPYSVEAMEENLFDIAGIRVICSFPDDIYTVAELITQQDDIRLIEAKDYIKNPKPNGYRSLHLILEVPIFLSSAKKQKRVEVQFRTIAMDFWASLEHKMKYKKDIPEAQSIVAELRECAEIINATDFRMQAIRDKIGTE